MADDVLDVRALTKRFGPLTAVDQVSFKVNKGEVLGFLGPSGLVEQQLEIMNLSGTTALAVSIYHMNDVDRAGAANAGRRSAARGK